MNIENNNVFIGVPRERFSLNQFVDNLSSIIKRLLESGHEARVFYAEGHRVDRNRDKIVKAFLEEQDKPDWLLMLDSDMRHHTMAPSRLMAHKVPVVGALYFHRGRHDPLVFVESDTMEDEWGRDIRMWEFMRQEVFDFLEGAGLPYADDAFTIDGYGEPLLECDAVGTGCMMIHRSVLEAMEPPWFEYRTGSESEDLTFCYRVRHELGLPVYCDLSTICGHYEMVPLGQAQFRNIFKARGITGTAYTREQAASQLAELAGIENAAEKLQQYRPAQLAELWEDSLSYGLDVRESTIDFYLREDVGKMYLLDLTIWNASPSFERLRRNLIGVQGGKVVEIGSGIGTVSIQLALQGCDVIGIEPNDVLRKYSAKRAAWIHDNKAIARMGKAKFVSHVALVESALGDGELYDLGVAIDVFEHMAPSDLHRYMSFLSMVIRPGGKLFVHNNFGDLDLYPMHIDYNETWGSIVSNTGFTQLDELWLMKM